LQLAEQETISAYLIKGLGSPRELRAMISRSH
jgi:hypothetical protein